jgi:uncharacterized membrane protein YbaN (DUF454 family)
MIVRGGDEMNQKLVGLVGVGLGLVGLFLPMLTEGKFYFDIQALAGVLFGYSAATLVKSEVDKEL